MSKTIAVRVFKCIHCKQVFWNIKRGQKHQETSKPAKVKE